MGPKLSKDKDLDFSIDTNKSENSDSKGKLK